jgi:hypothetical protein
MPCACSHASTMRAAAAAAPNFFAPATEFTCAYDVDVSGGVALSAM